MGQEKVLVSACLMGEPVRYDGASKGMVSEVLNRWQREERLVMVCPEVAGGLSVPREPAEIVGGSGADVLRGEARLVTRSGADVTQAFVEGANRALEVVQRETIRWALLKARSPSCGSAHIYNGSFEGQLMSGEGVTAALLRAHGVEVFSEETIDGLIEAVEAS